MNNYMVTIGDLFTKSTITSEMNKRMTTFRSSRINYN